MQENKHESKDKNKHKLLTISLIVLEGYECNRFMQIYGDYTQNGIKHAQ